MRARHQWMIDHFAALHQMINSTPLFARIFTK
jgi:hypothetical protein